MGSPFFESGTFTVSFPLIVTNAHTHVYECIPTGEHEHMNRYCRLLWFESASGERQHAFGLVFVLIWGGSALVSISTTLLGGKGISLLQSIGVLGYSLAPIVAAAVVCAIFPFRLAFFRLLFLGAGFYFAFPPAASYLRSAVPEDKVFLALYPLALLYASISALVLLV